MREKNLFIFFKPPLFAKELICLKITYKKLLCKIWIFQRSVIRFMQLNRVRRRLCGDVPERLNGPHSKCGIPQKGIGGSNPPVSAKIENSEFGANVASPRLRRGEATSSNLHFPIWRCILKIVRTEFAPRRAKRGSEWAGGQKRFPGRPKSWRRRSEDSKLPKNLKKNWLEPYFGRAKEIFS